MNRNEETPRVRGFRVDAASADEARRGHAWLTGRLEALGLSLALVHEPLSAARNAYRLEAAHALRWVPGFDTLALAQRWHSGLQSPDDALAAEILLSLLASPIDLVFPSFDELDSAVRMRSFIATAGAHTCMDFHTERVDRPEAFWAYDEDRGFLLKPGSDLVQALVQATQPEQSGRLYAFSCYRATEYVILLGIAQEARLNHPALHLALQQQWQQRAIASGRFHDTFLHEWGTNEAPLPMNWYVPGDRVWFRNPDATSSDVSGYEGSWVIYLGRGQFANFWKPGQPYDLVRKAVEVFHWRHGTCVGDDGELQMNENEVERRVAMTLADPDATRQVLRRMLRYKDPRGIYAEGGCMDTTRECPRWVRPGTTDIVLPDAPLQ